MDYSVGSLSDLITGSNTPNKVKVVKKEFKKEVSDLSENSVGEEQRKKKMNKNKTRKTNTITLKKAKLNKNNKHDNKTESQEFVDPNSGNDDDSKKASNKKSKGKKRKLEKSMPETQDADLDDNEEPPLKKEKLSKNDINAERRIKKKNKEPKPLPSPEELSRTIFVGNVPITTVKKNVKKHFKKYGEIKSLRFRGIPVADPKTSKKVAAIKKEYNPNRSNIYCYIKFVDKESAKKAEVENGALFEGHHLRVHCCETKNKVDESKAIFVGNLSFSAEEDELWNLFETCGPISYVRIIRDSYTGIGKGFAYVNFKDSDAVQLALEMENVNLNGRELRISLSNLIVASRNKKQNKKKKSSRQRSRRRNSEGKSTEGNQESDGQQLKSKESGARFQGTKFSEKSSRQWMPRRNFEGKSTEGNQESDGQQVKSKEGGARFQGTKFSDKKKKHKVNKGLLQKKKLMKKIAPKPK